MKSDDELDDELTVDDDDENLLDPACWTAIYVNVYLVDLAYGGPEEGGWYFENGQIIESHQVETYDHALELKQQLQASETYSNEGRRPISSVLSEGEYAIDIEPHEGRDFPEERPFYC